MKKGICLSPNLRETFSMRGDLAPGSETTAHRAYVFLLETKSLSTRQPVRAGCGCRRRVTGLADLHSSAGLDKSLILYPCRVSPGRFPRARCPSDQLPGVGPAHQLTAASHRTLLPFPQDSPLSLALIPCCKKALQHNSLFGHTVTPLSQLPLGSQCPAPCVSEAFPPPS